MDKRLLGIVTEKYGIFREYQAEHKVRRTGGDVTGVVGRG